MSGVLLTVGLATAGAVLLASTFLDEEAVERAVLRALRDTGAQGKQKRKLVEGKP